MTFPRRILYALPIVGVLITLTGLTFFTDRAFSAPAPACEPVEPNMNPIKEVHLKVYYGRGSITSSSTRIAEGSKIELDATAKDSSKRGTGAWKGTTPEWTYSGPATVADDCLTPTLTVTGPGAITAQVTVGGILSNKLTFSIGDTVNPDGTITPGSTASKEERCAYKDGSKYVCIDSSSTDADCTQTPECKDKQCERIDAGLCSAGGPDFPPSWPTPTSNPSDLGQLIQNVYLWSIGIVGLVVFVSFFYAGFMWLWGAAGDPGKISEAKSRMWNTLWGAILLFSAYVLLSTINPDLVGSGEDGDPKTLFPALPEAGKPTDGNPDGANPLPVE